VHCGRDLSVLCFHLQSGPTLKDSIRWMGLAAYLSFLAATTWNGLREKRIHKQYLSLHPPVTARVESRIKPTPAADGN
jgi:hypothetical protein